MEVIGSGRFARLIRRNNWEFVQRTNDVHIVVIVPILYKEDVPHLVVVEQYREPLQCNTIELPAGLAGDHGPEDILTAARRELEEETGYACDAFEVLTEGPVTAGLTDEVASLYLANGVFRVGEGGGDGSENITVHEVPLSQMEDWCLEQRAQGKRVDTKIFAALYFAMSRGVPVFGAIGG